MALSFRIPHELSIVGLSFGLGLACGNGGGGGGSLTDQFEAEFEKGWNIFCACYAEFGYDSKQECLVGFGGSDGLDACVKEVHDSSTEDDANQQCVLNALRQFNTCLGQLQCSEFGGYYESGFYDCYYQYYDAYEACPPLPDSFEMQLQDECYGGYSTSFSTGATAATTLTATATYTGGYTGDTFDCEDGSGTIPTEWVCDGDEDCDDGSDEFDCVSPPEDEKKPRFKKPKVRFHAAG